MNFCCDMGNTTVSLGLFVGQKLVKCSQLPTKLLRNDLTPFAEKLSSFLAADLPLKRAGVLSVVPDVEKDLLRLLEQELTGRPWLCNQGTQVPIPLMVDHPQEVGADRALGSWYAYEKHARALIVIDFGTAVTFDVISAAGEFQGGVIAPGIEISFEAMFKAAARLPTVEDFRLAGSVIGKNSVDCMSAAYFQGTAALVKGLVDMITRETGEKYLLVFTGGWINEGLLESFDLGGTYQPHLLLEGLNHFLSFKDAGVL